MEATSRQQPTGHGQQLVNTTPTHGLLSIQEGTDPVNIDIQEAEVLDTKPLDQKQTRIDITPLPRTTIPAPTIEQTVAAIKWTGAGAGVVGTAWIGYKVATIIAAFAMTPVVVVVVVVVWFVVNQTRSLRRTTHQERRQKRTIKITNEVSGGGDIEITNKIK